MKPELTGIRAVARDAGVSIATVSRFTCGGSVSESSRERITAAILRHGYTPNPAARALRFKGAIAAEDAKLTP